MVYNIAQQFRGGALMRDWRGCRGLDPPVALAVENTMPPYLIGIESMDMAPFSASRLPGNDARSNCRIDETDHQLNATDAHAIRKPHCALGGICNENAGQ